VNQRWCDLAGMTADAAHGAGWLQAVHPDDRERVLEEWREALAASRPLRSEFRFQHPNGVTLWVFAQVRVEESEIGGVPGYIGAITNITDRKRAEEQSRQLTADLERRVRERTRQLEDAYRELESFSAAMSRDLREPLRQITEANAELLRDCGRDVSARVRAVLERVGASAQRVRQAVDDLVEVAQVARADMRREHVDLSGLVAAIAAELRKADPRRDVEVVVAPDVAAWGDARLLRLALEKLLANAWRSTGTQPHAHIEFGAIEDGATVYFVRDDGVGLDAGTAGVPGGARGSTRSNGGRPGVGAGSLSTVQRIVGRHGGRMWTEAGVEQGATVLFTLGPSS
jgi:PAS domain S-box-containing protein